MRGREHLHRILLIEDDLDHALLVRRALAEAGPRVVVEHVTDPTAALRRLRGDERPPGPIPDLVLLDLRLPGGEGHELLVAIKTDDRLRAVPVIVVSTSGDERDVRRAYAAHANGYLTKPLDHARFRDAVQALARYWCGWNEPISIP